MVAEISEQHDSELAAICEVARLLGVGTAETVRKFGGQAQCHSGWLHLRLTSTTPGRAEYPLDSYRQSDMPGWLNVYWRFGGSEKLGDLNTGCEFT